MTMTRRDFEAVAGAIAETRRHEGAATRRSDLDVLVEVLIPRLREINPRFDPVRFRTASYPTTEET